MDTEKNDLQCSTSEENVKCRINIGGEERLFVWKKHLSLKDAVANIQKYHPNFSTTNHILSAEVKGRPSKVVVPPTLLCGWLKENTIIEFEKISELRKNGCSMVGHQTNLPKLDQQTIFFVKMDDRKNRPSITTISYQDYKHRELCVIANDGDTVLEALQNDGRFTNPEYFQLKNEEGCIVDGIDSVQAKALLPNNVFSVKGSRGRKRSAVCSRDSKAESKRIALGDCTNMASDGVTIKKEPDDNIPTSFSKSVTEAMYQGVVRKVKSMAYESFLDPSEAKNEKTRDKAICEFVKKQFSKSLDQSKSAWLIKKIAGATLLVGRIFCGHITATCFLVKEDIVMTNCHVYDDIVKQIQNPALPEEHKKATVLFNHEHPNQMENLVKVGVEIDEVIAKSPVHQLDYVLLGLKDHNHQALRTAQVKLFDVVFQNADQADQADGLVTIIGHPGGQPKAVDTDCRIISKYLWRNQVQKRVQKNVGFDSYFYLSQKIKKEIMSDEYEHKLAYDTSFFEGASGSPVINDQGLVVAMHRCGYKIDEMGPNSIAVMEFGVSMTAIFNDLYQKDRSLATKLFPHYQLPMDISHD